MDLSEFYCNLSVAVSPSVVAVEDTALRRFWVGCVIQKTGIETVVLTQSSMIKPNSQLVVHFDDNSARPATVLVSDSMFTILCLGGSYGNSTGVQLRQDPLLISEALCIVPKSVSLFQNILGRIPRPSCTSAGESDPIGTVYPGTDQYFLFVCHHEETAIMTPAPVFHSEGQVNGFVVTDCSIDDEVDIHVKICMKATRVEEILKDMLGDNDWKISLTNRSKQALSQSKLDLSSRSKLGKRNR